MTLWPCRVEAPNVEVFNVGGEFWLMTQEFATIGHRRVGGTANLGTNHHLAKLPNFLPTAWDGDGHLAGGAGNVRDHGHPWTDW